MRIVKFTASVVLLALSVVHGQQSAPTASPEKAAPPTIKKLTRAEFDALATKPARLLVIDVRRPDELTSIGGFPAYLSIQANDLANRLAYIPKDRAIVTVSNHASRATRAAELLKTSGFTVAGAIGAQDYESEGGTLVKIVPPPPQASDANPPRSGAATRQ